ncbi:DUF721 domain-containing protein [Actibacterium sp. 188UL27-1]|uniref:DUF721 domain-containing protein n=1 Tax=Actibacterium sp. 188UL27-1 TaxID=2786961 RepID=UPI001958395B|nr:DUF721 domain-containing protein [Actibacterium sp. 188UL27-1]MBM7070158.1 DUF721 domain-containing protein [Actibacterium sp. 188UL27-1]
MAKHSAHKSRRMRGFERASGLLTTRVRDAGAKRGFAVTRLLTHWSEIVGEDVAKSARPVDIRYGRDGFGATLTVLTTGAAAPMLQMQEPKIRAKVNAVYGYNAIARIRLTQTAPTGFAEGQAQFTSAPKEPKAPSTEHQQQAAHLTGDVANPDLRTALETLAKNVLTKTNSPQKDRP